MTALGKKMNVPGRTMNVLRGAMNVARRGMNVASKSFTFLLLVKLLELVSGTFCPPLLGIFVLESPIAFRYHVGEHIFVTSTVFSSSLFAI
jgi:hypothetical protein